MSAEPVRKFEQIHFQKHLLIRIFIFDASSKLIFFGFMCKYLRLKWNKLNTTNEQIKI